MKCPFCQGIIDDDSRYCDLCGKHLMFCPECRQPKKGVSCPRCGESLISAEEFFSAGSESLGKIDLSQLKPALILKGEDMTISVKEGEFGRSGGLFPELGSCQYVSGHHGELAFEDGEWKIRDLGSTNGTAIDGVKLEKEKWYTLRKGQKLKIATLKFTVE